jgi:hypothetical protein
MTYSRLFTRKNQISTVLYELTAGGFAWLAVYARKSCGMVQSSKGAATDAASLVFGGPMACEITAF